MAFSTALPLEVACISSHFWLQSRIGLFSGEGQTPGWFSDLCGPRTVPTLEKTLASHQRLTDLF